MKKSNACLPMKFATDGGKPKALEEFGLEKSSISSFNRIPVDGETTNDPNTRLIYKLRCRVAKVTVEVIATAFLSESTIEK